jgi:hypothetical protein
VNWFRKQLEFMAFGSRVFQNIRNAAWPEKNNMRARNARSMGPDTLADRNQRPENAGVETALAIQELCPTAQA